MLLSAQIAIGMPAISISGFGRISPWAANRDPAPAIGMMTVKDTLSDS
jgi:hypothetical protein